MRYYCFWKYVHFSVCQSCTHTQSSVYRQTPIETRMFKHAEHTHSQGRYNVINGGVSLTLINYNQIKDFISFISGAARLVTQWISAVWGRPAVTSSFLQLFTMQNFEINFNEVWKWKLDTGGKIKKKLLCLWGRHNIWSDLYYNYITDKSTAW